VVSIRRGSEEQEAVVSVECNVFALMEIVILVSPVKCMYVVLLIWEIFSLKKMNDQQFMVLSSSLK